MLSNVTNAEAKDGVISLDYVSYLKELYNNQRLKFKTRNNRRVEFNQLYTDIRRIFSRETR